MLSVECWMLSEGVFIPECRQKTPPLLINHYALNIYKEADSSAMGSLFF